MKKTFLKIFPAIAAGFLFFPGCARLWSPLFWSVEKSDKNYYERPVYYAGEHPLCQYGGPHVHDPKLGPVSVAETDPSEISKKYRYPGMKDSFQELDQRW